MVRTKSLFIVLSALFLLAGCAAPSPSRFGNKNLSPAFVRDNVQKNAQNVHFLTGNGKIAIESPDIAQSASFAIWIRKPDTLFVRLEGPFGIEIGSALVTKNDFSFYNSLQNQLITGSTTVDNLRQLLRIGLSFDEMMNLFSGGVFLPGDDSYPTSLETTDEYLIFNYKSEGHHRRYWIDPNSSLIARIQHLETDGKMFLEQRFQNYRAVEKSYIPFQMRMTMPKDRNVVSVSYSEVRVNDPSQTFHFSVPSNVQRLRLQ